MKCRNRVHVALKPLEHQIRISFNSDVLCDEMIIFILLLIIFCYRNILNGKIISSMENTVTVILSVLFFQYFHTFLAG